MCLRCGNGAGPSGYCRTCDPNSESLNRLAAIQRSLSAPNLDAADDRERRIRELAREWVGRSVDYPLGVDSENAQGLFAAAAEVIDALDAAEVPKKGGE